MKPMIRLPKEPNNSLNPSAQSFIPSPSNKKDKLHSTHSHPSTRSAPFSTLEAIPESPSQAPLPPQSNSSGDGAHSVTSHLVQHTECHLTTTTMPPLHPHIVHPPELTMPQMAHFPNPADMLALVPAMDQNGNMVMISPYCLNGDSPYTPLQAVVDPRVLQHLNALQEMNAPNIEPGKDSSIDQIVKGIERKFDHKLLSSDHLRSRKRKSSSFEGDALRSIPEEGTLQNEKRDSDPDPISECKPVDATEREEASTSNIPNPLYPELPSIFTAPFPMMPWINPLIPTHIPMGHHILPGQHPLPQMAPIMNMEENQPPSLPKEEEQKEERMSTKTRKSKKKGNKKKKHKKETEDPYATLIATANAATTSTPNIPSLFPHRSSPLPSLSCSSDDCSPPSITYRSKSAHLLHQQPTPSPPPGAPFDVLERDRSPRRLLNDKVPPRFKRQFQERNQRESRSTSPSKAKQGGNGGNGVNAVPHGVNQKISQCPPQGVPQWNGNGMNGMMNPMGNPVTHTLVPPPAMVLEQGIVSQSLPIPPPPPPQSMDSKVVYLKERGNRSNRGIAQYSSKPVPGSNSSGITTVKNGRRKQSISGMRFESKRVKDVHPCFKGSPELFARNAFESVMDTIHFRPSPLTEMKLLKNQNATNSPKGPQSIKTLNVTETAVKLINSTLNKLTPENFTNLVSKCKLKMAELNICKLSTLNKLGETFHSKVITQKPLVRLYCNFLVELSTTLVVHGRNIKDIVLELGWKAIDSQHDAHSRFMEENKEIRNFHKSNAEIKRDSVCGSGSSSTTSSPTKRGRKGRRKSKAHKSWMDDMEDDVALKALREDYNLWMERLFGNYVLITELYVMNRASFVFDRLHQVMTSLITTNQSWSWKVLFVVLTFHGVALQKKQTKALEEYLEAIDDLVDGIEYQQKCSAKGKGQIKKVKNRKYQHIPLRIKYLLMAVQEHIETKNARQIEGRGFLNPKPLEEVHEEFCRENNMTPDELRRELMASQIETHLEPEEVQCRAMEPHTRECSLESVQSHYSTHSHHTNVSNLSLRDTSVEAMARAASPVLCGPVAVAVPVPVGNQNGNGLNPSSFAPLNYAVAGSMPSNVAVPSSGSIPVHGENVNEMDYLPPSFQFVGPPGYYIDSNQGNQGNMNQIQNGMDNGSESFNPNQGPNPGPNSNGMHGDCSLGFYAPDAEPFSVPPRFRRMREEAQRRLVRSTSNPTVATDAVQKEEEEEETKVAFKAPIKPSLPRSVSDSIILQKEPESNDSNRSNARTPEKRKKMKISKTPKASKASKNVKQPNEVQSRKVHRVWNGINGINGVKAVKGVNTNTLTEVHGVNGQSLKSLTTSKSEPYPVTPIKKVKTTKSKKVENEKASKSKQQSHSTKPIKSSPISTPQKSRDRVRKKVNPLHKNRNKTSTSTTSGPLYMRNGDVPPPPKRTPPAVPARSPKKSKSARTPRNGKKGKNSKNKGGEENDGWITVKGSMKSNDSKERVMEAMKESMRLEADSMTKSAINTSSAEKKKRKRKRKKSSPAPNTTKIVRALPLDDEKEDLKEVLSKLGGHRDDQITPLLAMKNRSNTPQSGDEKEQKEQSQSVTVQNVDVSMTEKAEKEENTKCLTPSSVSPVSPSKKKGKKKKNSKSSKKAKRDKKKKDKKKSSLKPKKLIFANDDRKETEPEELEECKESKAVKLKLKVDDDEKEKEKPVVIRKVSSSSASASSSLVTSPRDDAKKKKKNKKKKNNNKPKRKSQSQRNIQSLHHITWEAAKESPSSKKKKKNEKKKKAEKEEEEERGSKFDSKVTECNEDFQSSDDEMCGDSSSSDHEDMIPALFFGGNNEEELNTALFCEVLDSMDEALSDDAEDYSFCHRDDHHGTGALNKQYYRYRIPRTCSLMSDEDELGESLSIPGLNDDDKIDDKLDGHSPRSANTESKDLEKEEEVNNQSAMPDLQYLQSEFSSSSAIAETMDNLESAGTEEERPIISTSFSESEGAAPSRAQIESMIYEILERYKESGNADEAFAFIHRYRDEETTIHRDTFITLCMKMSIGLHQLDDDESKVHSAEIERLFADRVYINDLVERNVYIRTLGSLSTYFARIVRCNETALHAVTKMVMSLIENGILSLTLIHNILTESQCAISGDIVREVIKHMLHGAMGDDGEIDVIVCEMKSLRFHEDAQIDFESIFRSLNLDYSLYAV